MGIFSKKEKVKYIEQKIFIDEFPTWAVKHSVKLAEELKKGKEEVASEYWSKELKNNPKTEATLTDCLIGAHLVLFQLDMPEGTQWLLLGEEKITTVISSWSENALNFALLTSKYVMENKGDEGKKLVDMFDSFYKSTNNKPADVISLQIAFAVAQTVDNEADHFLVAGLYGTIVQLKQEFLTWIRNVIDQRNKNR